MLAEGKITGVEIYTLNLVRELLAIDEKNEYVLFYNSASRPLPSPLPMSWEGKNVQIINLMRSNRLLNSLMRFTGWPKVDKLLGGLDIFFSPRHSFLALSKSCKYVITVHDLSFIHEPGFFSVKSRLWHWLVSDKKAAQNATVIIAVSKSTKQDLVKFFGIPEDRIHVVYPGVELHNPLGQGGKSVKQKYNLPEEYILFLGTIEPRKNVEHIIAAFEQTREKLNRPIGLVLAGRLGWLYKDVLKQAHASKFSNDIKFLDTITEAEKPELIKTASLLAFVSYYEGFGFPPLEGTASGVPVVAAMNSSIPEVMGDAVMYVNPFRVDQIAKAFETVLSDDGFRRKLIDEGLDRVKQFTWRRTAEQTLEVFTNLKF